MGQASCRKEDQVVTIGEPLRAAARIDGLNDVTMRRRRLEW